MSLPPGLAYANNFLSAGEQDLLLDHIDALSWKYVYGETRRVQHYGWIYDYAKRRVAREDKLEDGLPPFFSFLVERLHERGMIPKTQKIDQCIVNEYNPGQGIAKHIDHPVFDEYIASITLGSGCQMDFEARDNPNQKCKLYLETGSAMVMSGEARHLWKHSIASRKTDPDPVTHEKGKCPRGRRVSITFRTVQTDKVF